MMQFRKYFVISPEQWKRILAQTPKEIKIDRDLANAKKELCGIEKIRKALMSNK